MVARNGRSLCFLLVKHDEQVILEDSALGRTAQDGDELFSHRTNVIIFIKIKPENPIVRSWEPFFF